MPRYTKIINSYKREYGLQKYRKVKNHITNSRKTTRLIQDVFKNNSYPYGEDIVEMVLSHFRYSLAKSDTVLVASLIVLRELMNSLENSVIPVKISEIENIEDEILIECRDIEIR